jgi:hypothetical protein
MVYVCHGIPLMFSFCVRVRAHTYCDKIVSRFAKKRISTPICHEIDTCFVAMNKADNRQTVQGGGLYSAHHKL